MERSIRNSRENTQTFNSQIAGSFVYYQHYLFKPSHLIYPNNALSILSIPILLFPSFPSQYYSFYPIHLAVLFISIPILLPIHIYTTLSILSIPILLFLSFQSNYSLCIHPNTTPRPIHLYNYSFYPSHPNTTLSILSIPILLFLSHPSHNTFSILYIPIQLFLSFPSQYYFFHPFHPNTTLPILSIPILPFLSYQSQYYPFYPIHPSINSLNPVLTFLMSYPVQY